jgi:hypothetical protein
MKLPCLLILLSCALHAQGPLTPTGAPTPSQKSLQEIWDKISTLETQTAQLQAWNSTLVTQMRLAIDSNPNIPWSYNIIDAAGIVGWHTSLAFAPDGHPAVAYYDETNYDLKFAKFDGLSWIIITVASANGIGHEPCLTYAPDGQPAISFRDWTHQSLRYAKFDGSSWAIETVDSSGDAGRYSSLCFNSSGTPEIAYYDNANGNLKYATQLLGVWYPSTIDSSGDVGQFANLKISPNGTRHICYYDVTRADLKYAVHTNYNWVVSTIPPSSVYTSNESLVHYGKFCAMQFDPSGRPAIAYQDESSLKVRLVRHDGYGWVETADPNDNTPNAFQRIGIHDISLAFSPGGVPVVAFGAPGEGVPVNKLYVVRFEKDFAYEVVDARQNTGSYTSIRFGPDGLPAVTYFNDTDGDLMIARKILFQP